MINFLIKGPWNIFGVRIIFVFTLNTFNQIFKRIRAKTSESCVSLPLQSYRIFLELFFLMGANWVIEVSVIVLFMYAFTKINLNIDILFLEFFFLCVLV